jgi:hypothetical protein
MTEQTRPKTPFTLIYWQALDALELTIPDYLLLDTIHGFSLKTGWCYASRDELAGRVRMKTRWVYKQLAVFAERGLVEIDPTSRCIRPGALWHKTLKSLQAGQLPPVATEPRKSRKKNAGPITAPDTEIPAPHAVGTAPDAEVAAFDAGSSALHAESSAPHAGVPWIHCTACMIRLHRMQGKACTKCSLTLHRMQTILYILYIPLNNY